MSQMDFITTPRKVTKALVYSQKDLYKYMMKWFTERHYDIIEDESTEKLLEGGKKLYEFSWINCKRIEEFTKIIIEVDFSAEAEDVMTEDNKKAQKGTVSVKFLGYINKDVEDDLTLTKRPPERVLLRSIYERFFAHRRMARYEHHLKKDIDAIMRDLKTYLKVHRYD